MEMIKQAEALIIEYLGPFGPLMLLGALGFMMVVATLPILMKKEKDPLDRLKASERTVQAMPGKSEKLRTGGNGKDKLAKYATFLEPQNEEEFSAVKLKLMQAGYQGKNAMRMYYFLQFALGIAGLILGAIYALFNSTPESTMKDMLVWVLLPGGIGYLFPKYWVTRRQAVRQEEIENGFPDSLDMMLVCVEAGQSLDQSIIRVSRELKAGFPDLSMEFEVVSQQMKAGSDKATVLKAMSERCGVQDITSFVTVLIQSQQFGTSISDALRVYASEMRDKRVMKAEEKANKLPTKMTLATMMLTVPPLLVILVGPSLYDISLMLGNNN